jgi:hypothetical protein
MWRRTLATVIRDARRFGISTGIAGVHPARTPPRSVLQSRNRLAETAIRLWNTNNVFVWRLDGLRIQFGV